MVDAGQLFRNIASLREIDHGFDYLTPEQLKYLSSFWANILSARQSNDKDQFLNIWRKLDPLYRKFRERLSEKGWAYEGMLYRNMAEQLAENPLPMQQKIIALVGFNALNSCEKGCSDTWQTREMPASSGMPIDIISMHSITKLHFFCTKT
jgi:hypothetical protein